MRWPWQPDPDQPRRQAEALVEAGLKESAAGRFEQAASIFEQAVASVPSLLPARVNLGSAYYQLAQQTHGQVRQVHLEKAREQFGYVLGIDPNHAVAALNLAATLDALGEAAAALAQLQRLSQRHPKRRDVWYNLALALFKAGRIDEARGAAVTELEHHPDHRLAAQLLARLGAADQPSGESA